MGTHKIGHRTKKDSMMNRTGKMALAALVIGGVIGCVTQPPGGATYIHPGTVISGNPDKVTMYDLESAVQRLIHKMLAHPQFAQNYNAMKGQKGGKLPIVCQGLLENLTKDPGARSRLRAADDTIRAMLFDSALFEVKNDEAAEAIKARIIRGADGGIENAGELMKTLGEQEVPDFIVLGDLRHIPDARGYHTYRLHLSIHNLRTGKVVWEGIETRIKF